MYTSALDCAAKTLRIEGVRGMYKGLAATFFRLAPHTSIMWVVQEQVGALLRKRHLANLSSTAEAADP